MEDRRSKTALIADADVLIEGREYQVAFELMVTPDRGCQSSPRAAQARSIHVEVGLRKPGRKPARLGCSGSV